MKVIDRTVIVVPMVLETVAPPNNAVSAAFVALLHAIGNDDVVVPKRVSVVFHTPDPP